VKWKWAFEFLAYDLYLGVCDKLVRGYTYRRIYGNKSAKNDGCVNAFVVTFNGSWLVWQIVVVSSLKGFQGEFEHFTFL